jgi:cytochrome c oxidase subunit 4
LKAGRGAPPEKNTMAHTEAHDPLNVTNPEHGEHHIVTPLQYSFVYIALLIGTGLTVAAAYLDLGVLNPIVALGIACTKASLVILFFMHAKYQSRLIQLTIAAGFFTFLILVTMSLADYMSRSWGLW